MQFTCSWLSYFHRHLPYHWPRLPQVSSFLFRRDHTYPYLQHNAEQHNNHLPNYLHQQYHSCTRWPWPFRWNFSHKFRCHHEYLTHFQHLDRYCQPDYLKDNSESDERNLLQTHAFPLYCSPAIHYRSAQRLLLLRKYTEWNWLSLSKLHESHNYPHSAQQFGVHYHHLRHQDYQHSRCVLSGQCEDSQCGIT